MEYQCTLIRGKRKEHWQGEIRLIHYSDTCYEAEITGRGTYFHVIAGKHRYGNYICIPKFVLEYRTSLRAHKKGGCGNRCTWALPSGRADPSEKICR